MKFFLILIFSTLITGGAHADTVSVNNFLAYPQERSNWCWAASIQSIFLTKGLNVTQSNIVTAAYGAPINRVAPGFDGTTRILNGLSISADGSMWSVRASAGNTFPNANWLYKEIKNGAPVMIWYNDNISNHSIVINGGIYNQDSWGNVYWHQIWAYDPWHNRNMTIDAANIPRFVYGSFVIKLEKLKASKDVAYDESDESDESDKTDTSGCAKETTAHGYIRQGCEDITIRRN